MSVAVFSFNILPRARAQILKRRHIRARFFSFWHFAAAAPRASLPLPPSTFLARAAGSRWRQLRAANARRPRALTATAASARLRPLVPAARKRRVPRPLVARSPFELEARPWPAPVPSSSSSSATSSSSSSPTRRCPAKRTRAKAARLILLLLPPRFVGVSGHKRAAHLAFAHLAATRLRGVCDR